MASSSKSSWSLSPWMACVVLIVFAVLVSQIQQALHAAQRPRTWVLRRLDILPNARAEALDAPPAGTFTLQAWHKNATVLVDADLLNEGASVAVVLPAAADLEAGDFFDVSMAGVSGSQKKIVLLEDVATPFNERRYSLNESGVVRCVAVVKGDTLTWATNAAPEGP